MTLTQDILKQILAELKTHNQTFNKYYDEWTEHQQKHDNLMGEAKESIKLYENIAKKMKPEDLERLSHSLAGVDIKEISRVASYMIDEKQKEDEEFQKKLKGIK